MTFLLRHIRTIVLLISGIVATIASNIQPVHQTYSFLALIYLYISLLSSPLYSVFPTLPFRGLYIKARRSIGQSAFVFAGLHGYFSFINVVGGLHGLKLLDRSYALKMSLGTLAFIILSLMASTSFDKAVAFLGPTHWKNLHRLVYLAGVLIIFHVYLIGPHFANRFSPQSIIFFIALVILFSLEAIRFKKYLSSKLPH
ncbi:ferric reductase-like transmembrane domain-containing protein [Candidatus Roizmanbacteria bacterium]|nr:ferric reductase-like transmembrane domain-containing protein [Candidatus Roizmanbacteria bacterium]